jgi:hypothetical protein
LSIGLDQLVEVASIAAQVANAILVAAHNGLDHLPRVEVDYALRKKVIKELLWNVLGR